MATGFYLLDNPQPHTQQWGYPRRGAKLTGTCIIHTAECAIDYEGADTAAEGTAVFIRNRSDYGSYHDLVDSDSIIEMVPFEYEAWQDSETNPWAVGISAAVTANDWLTIPVARRNKIYRNMAWCAADFVKYMKEAYNITVPLRRITGAQARAGVPGFCAHGDSGISRYDPGPDFDWALFFRYTQEALNGTVAAQASATAKKELDVAPKWKRMISKPADRRLAKGLEWYLKDASGKINENYASLGAGSYDIDLFIQGNGLFDGESIQVQFYLVNTKNGKREASGYFPQEVHGSTDGVFKASVRFKMPVAGKRLEVGVMSTSETAHLKVYGADVYNLG
ncbi:endolysin [Arthrobacter phage Wollypog]|uniref:Endolysin n=1 Tax=Arthrobacter phage Wollypog TaxID=2790985 RepID=A0A7T3KC70_9CAUD|nr:endolysin [Arthrobacter phage Wollypog]QPX62576.1 endolysin [Arthrobacter phage Wollypog]